MNFQFLFFNFSLPLSFSPVRENLNSKSNFCHFNLRRKYFAELYDLMGPHHFSETSFHRIVVLRFAGMQFCRIVVFPEKKIAKSHLTGLAKLHNAERHFSESLFSRKSFSRIVVQPNVIFPNRRSAVCRFPETSFARTSFCRNCINSGVGSAQCIFGKMMFG